MTFRCNVSTDCCKVQVCKGNSGVTGMWEQLDRLYKVSHSAPEEVLAEKVVCPTTCVTQGQL